MHPIPLLSPCVAASRRFDIDFVRVLLDLIKIDCQVWPVCVLEGAIRLVMLLQDFLSVVQKVDMLVIDDAHVRSTLRDQPDIVSCCF